MIRALASTLALALLHPAAATAQRLDCTFTAICSPLTECQDHDGVPFSFDLISGALGFLTEDGISFGTPRSNATPPAVSVIFDGIPDSTILLTVSASGEAVMTQHDIMPADRIQSVSYFGTCEPGT